MKKNQHGISLVEILVSLAILGGTAVIVMNGASFQLKSKEIKETTEVSMEANRDALEGFHNILFDIKNDANKKHDQGVCTLISKDVYAAPPVGAININLSGLKGILNDTARLKKYLPLWKIETGGNCNSDYVKCFTLDEKNQSTSPELVKLNPLLKLTVTPVYMNPKVAGLFEAIKIADYKKDIDVKAVGFTFKSDLEINIPNKSKTTKHLETFEWTGQAGYCDLGANKLSFSGMEYVSGANVIFNRQGFATNKEAPFDIVFRQTVAQSGKYDSSGRFVFTDQSQSIATSCKETNFRCRQESSDQREYDSDLGVIADIGFITPNELTTASSLPVLISYDIKKGDTGSIFGSNEINTFMSDGADCGESRPKTANSVPNCTQTNSFSKTMYGDQFISIAMWDKNTTNTSSKICRRICDKSENYNLPNNDSQQAWSGYLSILVSGYNKTYKYKVSDNIGCTACFMKNCDQFGIGTFGAMNKMPYQPLDAQIPECAVHEPKQVLYDPLPYKGNSIANSGPADQCVYAKLNSTKDGFNYSTKNCNDKLPVMCFAYGKFLLARNISSSASALDRVPYTDSAKRCFEMGHEIVDKKKLDAYMTGQGRPQLKSTMYDFYNLAQQGLFIAPQIPEDITTFKTWAEAQGLTNTEFWVALESNKADSFDVRLPLIPSSVDNVADAVYFNGSKELIYTNYAHKLPAGPSNNLGYGILFHNIKYKGVRLFKKLDPISVGFKLPFLCRKDYAPFEIFKSSGISNNIEDGPVKCLADGGLFLPPVTTYEWVRALTVVDPVSRKHSFPDVGTPSSSADFKMAWVAVQADSSDLTGIKWEAFSSSHLDNNFLDNPFGVFVDSSKVMLNSLGQYVDLNQKTSNEESDIKSESGILGNTPSDGILHIVYNSTEHFRINIQAGMTPLQVVDLINSNSSLDGKIKAEYETNAANVNKVKLEGLQGKNIYLYKSGLTDFLKFNVNKTLELRKLCLSSTRTLQVKMPSDACDTSSRISISDINSKSFKVLWSLNRFNKKSMIHYVFEK